MPRVLTAACLLASAPLNGAAEETEPAAFALANPGDPTKGRQVFEAAGSLCATCHTVGGGGSKVGPDLSTIGDKFDRPGMIRAITDPGFDVAVGFATTSIQKKDGTPFAGVVKSISAEAVEIIGVDGVTRRIATADIASKRTDNISLMPPGLHTAMKPGDFADLVAWLGSLRSTSADNAPGTPDEIPRTRTRARLEPLFDLRFDHPTLFGWVPGSDDQAALVLGHAGMIWAVEGTGGQAAMKPFLDLTGRVVPGGATGLLGLAFHPRFETNRRYFLQYQIVEDDTTFTLIEERTMKPGRIEDSGAPAREIIRIKAATLDHCGGSIAFGTDGFLWFGMGDTGPHRDPQGHGQEMSHLLGKMLRIDVDRRDGELAYAIPPDNPFVARDGVRPEIWATGFRNPYRFSWDSATGDLWVADVGQDRFDEVAIVRRGENHGWNVFEGHAPFSDVHRREGGIYIPPVMSYGRKHGVSVTGGQVYHGGANPALDGWYVFGDYESRRIWALRQHERKLDEVVEIARAPSRITAFVPDQNGELSIVCFDDGRIYRLHPEGVDPSETEPADESDRR